MEEEKKDTQLDALEVCGKIYQKNDEIEEIAGSLEDAAIEKADAVSNYDRQLTITTFKLKNGLIKSFLDEDTGEIIDVPLMPPSTLEKMARGIIYKECFEKEAKDAGYKAKISILDAKKAQLNGLQSINKVLQ